MSILQPLKRKEAALSINMSSCCVEGASAAAYGFFHNTCQEYWCHTLSFYCATKSLLQFFFFNFFFFFFFNLKYIRLMPRCLLQFHQCRASPLQTCLQPNPSLGRPGAATGRSLVSLICAAPAVSESTWIESTSVFSGFFLVTCWHLWWSVHLSFSWLSWPYWP